MSRSGTRGAERRRGAAARVTAWARCAVGWWLATLSAAAFFASAASVASATSVALLVAQAASAAPAHARVTIEDDSGARLDFTQPPARLISLLPSLTEAVCALGACDRLVGVDRYSNSPAAVTALPHLGGLEDTQVERVVALRADLILAAPSARVIDRLRALGQPVLVLHTRDHREVRRSLEVLGDLLGERPRADASWRAIEAQLAQAAARVPAAMRGQRVYFEVASAPYAAGSASFIGETLARLGLGNIVPADMGPFPRLNPEFVVRAQPDIVMAVDRELARMPARPGWSRLRALSERRACGFAPARYEMLVRPGPRLGEAALALADCVAGLAAGQ